MRKLTVLCDLDGIVVDLLGPWLAAYNAKWDDNLTPDHITDWNIHQFAKPECGFKMYDFIDSGEVYKNLRALPGAVEGIKQIEKMGHEVIMVSAGSKNLATAGHKLEWCKEFLKFSRKKCIIAHKKELVCGDVFIDDSPENILKYRERWPDVPIMTISHPYNQRVADVCWRAEGHKDTEAAWKKMVFWVSQVAEGYGIVP